MSFFFFFCKYGCPYSRLTVCKSGNGVFVKEEASGLVFKGWLDFTVAHPQWCDVLDVDYSRNKSQIHEVLLVLGSAD